MPPRSRSSSPLTEPDDSLTSSSFIKPSPLYRNTNFRADCCIGPGFRGKQFPENAPIITWKFNDLKTIGLYSTISPDFQDSDNNEIAQLEWMAKNGLDATGPRSTTDHRPYLHVFEYPNPVDNEVSGMVDQGPLEVLLAEGKLDLVKKIRACLSRGEPVALTGYRGSPNASYSVTGAKAIFGDIDSEVVSVGELGIDSVLLFGTKRHDHMQTSTVATQGRKTTTSG